jgi:chromosome segregation ATPase
MPPKKPQTAKAAQPEPIAPAPVPMTVNVAMGNVKNVVHAYKGDRNEHNILQESLETLANTLNSNLEELEEAEKSIQALEGELEAAVDRAKELEEKLEAAHARIDEFEPDRPALKAAESPEAVPAAELPPRPINRHASRFQRATPNATAKQ